MLVALEALMYKPAVCERIFIDVDPSQLSEIVYLNLDYFRAQLFDT